MSRKAQIARKTGETDIQLSLVLDGTGQGTRSTGVGFFDHMLDAVARHGGFDLTVAASGDLGTGAHHTVEDVGIAFGQALDETLADRAGIVRFGHAVVPMDEARAACAIDVSGRPLATLELDELEFGVPEFDRELLEEFMRGVTGAAKLTLHLRIEAGTSPHHKIEAAFKAFARALRQAVALDPGNTGIPSTKGLL